MKFILRTIFNFFKFAVISGILIGLSIIASFRLNINVDAFYFLLFCLAIVVILVGLLIFKRHYIAFKRDDLRQNITSVVFIIAGLCWIKFVTEYGIMLFYGFSVSYYMG